MTAPDSNGKTVINIPDPGESSTDGPSPIPAINGECMIEGDENGTTTIIVSGGHLGGVANVGFEDEEEEEDSSDDDGDDGGGIVVVMMVKMIMKIMLMMFMTLGITLVIKCGNICKMKKVF
jgi:hypothetical protein